MISATEELRRLLDECEVEWEAWNDCITVVVPSIHFLEVSNGTLCVVIVDATPEQAIAATLGWGMLTADDVRDLIERHSDASGGNGRDFHNGAYVAIADELNATLGRKVVDPTTNDVDAEVGA